MYEIHLLDEVEPERPNPSMLKGLHPLVKTAVCIFGFQLNPPIGHDQYCWLWHEASIEKREAVLATLWGYPYVREYLVRFGVITGTDPAEQRESLVNHASLDYGKLPESIRFLTVYANGDGGLHQNHVREHGLFLLSKQELADAILPTNSCHVTQTDTHPLVVNAGWAEN